MAAIVQWVIAYRDISAKRNCGNAAQEPLASGTFNP
jgi:hypothetical protein